MSRRGQPRPKGPLRRTQRDIPRPQARPFDDRTRRYSKQNARVPFLGLDYSREPHSNPRRTQVPLCPHRFPHPSGHYQVQASQGPYQDLRGSNQVPQRTATSDQSHQQVNKETATTLWTRHIRLWYPKLLTKTYFLPPLHFNKVPYDVENVAQQAVLVPRKPTDQPVGKPIRFAPNVPFTKNPKLPLASLVWPDQPVPAGPLPKVQDNDAREDRALRLVLDYIVRELAEREVMMVLSKLDYRKYLDKQVDPISAAAIRLFPKPTCIGHGDGDFDLIIISLRYGLIVGEIKSVGAENTKTQDLNSVIVAKAVNLLQQLKKAEKVLKHMVKDLASVRITKTLVLPNIKSEQLLQALKTNPSVAEDFLQSLGATDLQAAVGRCLCLDYLQSHEWWNRAVTALGPDATMTRSLYETLVARFCGPATSVEVPTVTHPRHAVELRTLPEAVAHTGLRMAILTLYPDQVQLLRDPNLPRAFLLGPPGTGKTVVLVLKGLQWGLQGMDIHLVSSHRDSRAVIMLIECQLQHILWESSDAATGAVGRVRTHWYDFENSRGDVETAVHTLASAAQKGQLCVLADEAFSHCKFHDFCDNLVAKVPDVQLWAAGVQCEDKPSCMITCIMTNPLRCPPNVVKEVQESSSISNGGVYDYTNTDIPAPTDGPSVIRLHHYKDSERKELTIGHKGDWPWQCTVCADEVAKLVTQKTRSHIKCPQGRERQSGHDLEYRDIVILCHSPRANLPVVSSLIARGVRVQVVTSDDEIHVIKNVALARDNQVTVTDWHVVLGLERRLVIVMGEEMDSDRLLAMSRTTAQLVLVL